MRAPTYRWQPSSAEIAAAAGIAVERVQRMDQNTSPIPTNWIPGIIAEHATALNDYPDASYRVIRDAVGRHLGIDADHENMSSIGRPIPIVEGGEVVSEVLA